MRLACGRELHERFKKARPLASRSFGKAAIPLAENPIEFAAQRFQFCEGPLDAAQFFPSKGSHTSAGNPPAIAYRKNARQLRQRKAQRDRAPDVAESRYARSAAAGPC